MGASAGSSESGGGVVQEGCGGRARVVPRMRAYVILSPPGTNATRPGSDIEENGIFVDAKVFTAEGGSEGELSDSMLLSTL